MNECVVLYVFMCACACVYIFICYFFRLDVSDTFWEIINTHCEEKKEKKRKEKKGKKCMILYVPVTFVIKRRKVMGVN